MADRSRGFTLAAIALPLLLLAMSGRARANDIIVNTLDGGSDPAPLCTLEDAVTAVNIQAPVNGCAAGTGLSDTILFLVSGTIFPDTTLTVGNPDEDLTILGPPDNGITLESDFDFALIVDDGIDLLDLENLTLAFGGAEEGGGLFAEDSAVAISGCTFLDNFGFVGAAILAVEDGMSIVNSTFVGNEALDAGGGIFDVDSLVALTNVTFDGNESADGAAVFEESGPIFANSTIFANSIEGGNCDGVEDAGYNISDDNSCGFTAPSVNNSTTLNLDPAGLQNNGGPTETVALESPSQAIDFVPIASCLNFFDDPVTVDQRGFGRPDPGNPNFCDAGAYEFGAAPTFVIPTNGERVQIARSSSPNSDMVNMGLVFTENGAPTCQPDQDALNAGLNVALYPGACGGDLEAGLQVSLAPFRVSNINHQSFGNFYESLAPGSPEIISARIVALKKPAAPACGEWTLNLEVSGLNTSALALSQTNPFALVLSTADGDFAQCFTITNAVAGNQIPPPIVPVVRRGARR